MLNQMLRSLKSYVEQRLDFILCGQVPEEALAAHAQQVLEATLLRPLHTRGRDDGCAKQSELLQWKSKFLKSVGNGDWRNEQICHFCVPGCCPGGRAEAVQRLVDAYWICFFEPLGQSYQAPANGGL